MPNIEIKARYPDLARGRETALSLGAVFQRRDRQVDTYFKAPSGRLKLRESSANRAELIPYFRPDRKGPKLCRYEVIPILRPRAVKALFKALYGIEAVVDKTRDIYLKGNIRVHLDRVRGLGDFLEFEAVFRTDSPKRRALEKAKVQRLLRLFGVKPGDLLENSYLDMVRSARRR